MFAIASCDELVGKLFARLGGQPCRKPGSAAATHGAAAPQAHASGEERLSAIFRYQLDCLSADIHLKIKE